MKPNHVSGAGALVEAVDVLSDQRESRASAPRGQDRMCRVRLGLCDGRAAPVVPLPDRSRIMREGFRRRELFSPEVPPQPVVAAKRRDSAGCRDTCASEHDDGAGVAQAVDEFFGIDGHRSDQRQQNTNKTAGGHAAPHFLRQKFR